MKRSLFIIVCILLTYTDILAGDRTEQKMKQAAIQVLGRSKARGESNKQIKEFLTLSKLKIYGYDEGGFAVVTSDDRFDDVIGYSSSIYAESVPCEFEWWLKTVDKNMQTINVPTYQRAKTRGSSNSEF